MSRKLVIGLIGGMGSGKTTVAGVLARLGARVISGDALGHEALRQPQVRDWVVQRWGPAILDATGGVDRRKVAEIVFADPVELHALETRVFPWIRRRIQEGMAEAAADNQVRLIVLDAAVMLEAGWDELCDRLVYVHAPREERLRRITQERGWSVKEVENRESVQRSLMEKASRADDLFLNAGSPAELETQVKGLLCRWGLAGPT